MNLRRTAILLPLIAAAGAAQALAGTLDNATCRRELAAVAQLDATFAKLKAPAGAPADAACAAYRSHFLVVVKARAAVAACKTGPDREQEVGRLDGTVEDINGAIAQSCTGI